MPGARPKLAITDRDARLIRPLLRAVCFHMVLGCVLGMFSGVDMVSMGDMRVVRGFLMVPGFMMFGCLFVMARRMLMMLGCVLVVLSCFLRHVSVPFALRPRS
jgi:hypothetical protein